MHSAAITSAIFIKKTDEDGRLVGTASHDLTARLTEITISPTDPSPSRILASLHLHTGPLTSISVNVPGSQLLTSSTDGLIGLWDTTVPKSDEVPLDDAPSERRKRRKIDDGQESRPKRKAPVAVLKSHTARISKAIFAQDGKSAVSAGFDSTVRTWDVESGVCTSTIVSGTIIIIVAIRCSSSLPDRICKTFP